MTDAAPAKSRSGLRLAPVLLIAAAVLVAAILAVYAARRTIAREALTGWLRSRGIASEAEVQEIGPGRFVGRLRIGDPRNPDFVAGDAEVAYAIRGLSVEVASVTLVRPVLRARVHNGRLSVGALDPLIEEFRRRPPRPGAKQPRIRIDDGVVWLTTDYGPVQASADVLVDDGKLMSLVARSAPARLKGPQFDLALGAGGLAMTTRRDRVDARLDLPAAGALGAARIEAGRLQVTANAPYPDLVKRRGDGALTVAAKLVAARLEAGGPAVRDARLSAGFSGQAAGWIPDLTVAGKLAADLTARSAEASGANAGGLRGSVTSEDLRWTRKGGDRVAGQVRLTAQAERAGAADLVLTNLVLAARGPFAADRSGLRLSLGGSAVGHGRWTGLGAPTREDSAELAAVKRAAQGFRFAAPAVQAELAPRLSARLVQPVRLIPDRGGEVRLAQAGDAWRLTVAGGGMPAVDASLRNLRLADGGGSADLALKTGLSIGPIVGGRIDAAGRARLEGGALTFTAARCAAVQAERLEFGDRDIERLSGRICPTGAPLFTFAGGDWRIAGRAEGIDAIGPFLQARVEDAAGRIDLGLRGGRLHALLTAEHGRIADAAAEPRFNPLELTGRAELARDVWNADFALATPAGVRVATGRLRHEALTGKGGLEFDTGTLRFAEGGLQPAQLSPLAEGLGSPAVGEARFSGGFAWLAEAAFSAGKLEIGRLDFKSPAGQVTGLSGTVAFASLAPLLAAPGQQLRAERLDALVPVTDLSAGLEIKDEVLHITGGAAAIEGGRVRIETLEVPLTPDAAIKGTLAFEGVQLKNFAEASPFGDWMDMDAKVSGRIPFETQGGQVRISGGDLKAVEPGRLSIRRELFTGAAGQVQADVGGQPAVDQNQTFTDLAYQAMENLAFTQLDAAINSRPDGRMGVLFHVVGRHDPPQKQEIRLSLMDLIRRRFLGRTLPLPSGTGVNLTLDTTLNLDQLLADYAEFRRTRGSGQVQP